MTEATGVNLQRIHRRIIEYLDTETQSREGYIQREVQILTEIETTEGMSPETARKLRHELHEIRERSTAHENLLFYLAETSPLVEEFTQLLKIPVVKRGFMSRKAVKPSENVEVIKRKTEITQRFLQLANKYCGKFMDIPGCSHTPVASDDPTPEICEECGSGNVTINVSDSMVCCLECAYEFTMVTDSNVVTVTTNTDDPSRVSSRYEAILHFKSSMAKYQGKQQTTIPQSVYSDLHHEISRIGLLAEFAQGMSFDELVETTRNTARRSDGVMSRLIHPESLGSDPAESTPYNGAYSRVTHDHVILFLRQTRHEKHYEDVMLIHWTMTGVSPPNIGHLEAVLEQDFQDLMALYHQEYVIKRNPALEDGKSFKSNYYILYRLLQKHKYPCRRRDFSNMLKTADREIFYDTVCKDLFGKLRWEFNSDF